MDLSNLTQADWRDLIDMSFDQGVAAVAVDGLQRGFAHENEDENGKRLENEGLDAWDSPKLEDLKYEWFGEVFQAEEYVFRPIPVHSGCEILMQFFQTFCNFA